MNTERIIRDIEDLLFVRLGLDAWERALYWHLFRHTQLEGREAVTVGLDTLSRRTGISTTKLRDTIRSMAAKGCVSIDDRTRIGHAIKLLLPSDIPGIAPSQETPTIDLETIDFYTGRLYLQPLMERQTGLCFYCLRSLTAESAALDHLVPQVNRADNSHRNIVVACYECNSRKQAQMAETYLRVLYREGVLSQTDLKERLEAVSQVASGCLRPVVGDVAPSAPKDPGRSG